MLPNHNQRVGQQVQRHSQPAPLHAHHELVPFQICPLLIENIHASSLPEKRPEPPQKQPIRLYFHREFFVEPAASNASRSAFGSFVTRATIALYFHPGTTINFPFFNAFSDS